MTLDFNETKKGHKLAYKSPNFLTKNRFQMKKAFLILTVLMFSLPLVQAQELTEKGVTALTAEEQAVKQVIEDETKYFNLRDYEKWTDCVAKDPMTVYSWTTPFHGENSIFEAKGWEEVSKHMKKYIETMPVDENIPKKYDYQFKVSENMAYVNFLEGNDTHETRVLEKRDGKWKILRMEATASKMFKSMHKKYALQRMAGNWKLDPNSVKIEGGSGWKLLASQVKAKSTNTGLKAYATIYIEKPNGEELVIEDESIIAYDLGTEKVALFSASYFPKSGWSETEVGIGEVDDDGVLHFESHQVGKDSKSKGMMKIDKDGKMHYSVEKMNEKGEKLFSMSYSMTEDKPTTAMRP